MAQDPLVTVQNVPTLERLEILERNVTNSGALTPALRAAIETRYADFGRQMVAAKTRLDLTNLTPAELKIVNAIGRYVGLQKRDGKGAERTFQLLRNRGLLDAAEVTVARSRVTQGFEVLDQADLRALSFEQIIVDHAEEFSARALWYARRTLGLANESEKAPADLGTPTQQRTEKVLDWLEARAVENNGLLNGYTNADLGRLLGFMDLSRHGRVLGNIQSRIDFACYAESLPPLGLCAREPFANAWAQQDRRWHFPIENMRAAAQTFTWTSESLTRVRRTTRTLPGQAAIPWQKEISEREHEVRTWAESLRAAALAGQVFGAIDIEAIERKLLGRRPEVRERISRQIERGPIGQQLKRANEFKCQLCEALGLPPVSFSKRNGEPYVEAHHATPVSELELGSLTASNIMILCANHHRQMHFGDVIVARTAGWFEITLDGETYRIRRFGVG